MSTSCTAMSRLAAHAPASPAACPSAITCGLYDPVDDRSWRSLTSCGSVLGGSERGGDLLDRRSLLVLHPALGLRDRIRDVEHEAAIGLQLVRGLRVQHCHRTAQGV